MNRPQQALIGEPLALDFLNTLVSGAEPTDFIGTPERLRFWLEAERPLLCFPTRALTKRDVEDMAALRDATRQVVDAARNGTLPSHGAVVALNAAVREAPAVRQLRWNGEYEEFVFRDGDALAINFAVLAEATFDLAALPDASRIRQCAGTGCVQLFMAINGRRQWCSADICGNRARVARYYNRHKAP